MPRKTSRHIIHDASEHRTVRFALVGIVNTSVDFIVLFVLVTAFHLPLLLANIFSTSAALTVSYLLNKRAVFRNTDMHNMQQVLLFITVTLIGLWFVQGLIIIAVSSLLWVATDVQGGAALVVAKLTATAVSLLWNYLLYSRVVFKDK